MKNRRKFTRIPVNEQAQLISVDAKQQSYPVRLFDISAEGLGFLSDQFFSSGRSYTIQYSILNKKFSIPVSIQWTESTPEGVATGCVKDIV